MAALTDMSTPRPAPAWRQKASRFWRWWSQELVALVPQRFGALGGASRDERARLKIDLAVVSVLLDAGAGPDWTYVEPGTGQVFRLVPTQEAPPEQPAGDVIEEEEFGDPTDMPDDGPQ